MSIFLSNLIINRRCFQLGNKLNQNLHHLGLNNSTNAFFNRRKSHTKTAVENETFVPFLEQIKLRKNQAKRSILVQVQSAQSFKELHSYCNAIGTIRHMFHYSTGVDPLHFILIEFERESDVNNVLQASSYLDETQGVPTYSQFLWFRASNRKLAKLKQDRNFKLLEQDSTNTISDAQLKDLLKSCQNVSDQMQVLHNATRLNDMGSRLRFLTARQIELAVAGMFPHASAYPFGSSVNGCGRMGCDLDLVLRLDDRAENEDSRLIFHCKAAPGSERSTSQRHMETIGDLIHLFLPGCAQVRRILQARVPIIKFHQQFSDVECDLSMSNMSGVHMSDFLYIMGEIDERVRPLIFAVRRWAHEVSLTNSSPGRWISNFSLTLLVLAFLQNPLSTTPILPSLNTLTKLAGPQDRFVTEDGIDCTFLRDVNKLRSTNVDLDSLETLLCEFFEYYSQFDFSEKAVCLNESGSITKPEHSALYIVNPIERGLNVSKNVSIDELERFKTEVRSAAWLLESQEGREANWGLLALFENKKKVYGTTNFAISSRQRRLMEVSTLFGEEEAEKVIRYQNEDLKKEVDAIKRQTQEKIKELNGAVKRQKSNR